MVRRSSLPPVVQKRKGKNQIWRLIRLAGQDSNLE
jgi:hypothetical protein